MNTEQAIRWALTGTRVTDDIPLADWLADDTIRSEIVAIAKARRQAREPWPIDVPSVDRGVGAAQWAALLKQVITQLGLDQPEIRTKDYHRQLTSDELRLVADIPPHHIPH